MNETTATIEDVRTDLSITEGRLGVTVEGEEATARLRTPRHEPLSRHEPVLTLEVTGDGFQGAVWFDADDAEALARVLAEATDEVVAP